MIKRVGLFLMVNILVMVVASFAITFITGALGLGPAMSQNGINYASLMVICLVWGMVGSFISLFISKWLAKRAFGLEIVELNSRYSNTVQKVHHLAQSAGIEKMPEVGIYDSPEINAFATGATKNSSLVAVSTGLLNNLTEDEVEGVLGHEIAHIANGDMVTLALIQGIVNAFVMFFARIATMIVDNALRGDNDNGRGLGFFAYFIIYNLFSFLFGILASPLVFWFSRWREFRADAGSAKLAGREKMINALEALKRTYQSLEPKGLKIPTDSNVRAMQISSKIKFGEIFSTHPTLDKRIAALREMRG
jgi:heat shock protein HtpX